MSFGAVEHLLYAIMAGQGYQAQFNLPDLGGMGQWSLGGLSMVGDMFNNQLKARVDTEVEIEYLENGGVLHYVLRNLAKA